MRSFHPSQLIVRLSAALALILFIGARPAFAQDAADSGTSTDASWERTGPSLDEDAESADKVLEIPQASCNKEGASVECPSTDEDGNQTVYAPSPGAPPATMDDDTADSDLPNEDWGTISEYQDQPSYAIPYGMAAYGVTATGGASGYRSPLPASAYVPMTTSSPLTQAARPPLNPGPWMLQPSMSAFGRPAGSPMAPMMMSGFHH
jgi:hypothetical protein